LEDGFLARTRAEGRKGIDSERDGDSLSERAEPLFKNPKILSLTIRGSKVERIGYSLQARLRVESVETEEKAKSMFGFGFLK
jgi:hypothetical protein